MHRLADRVHDVPVQRVVVGALGLAGLGAVSIVWPGMATLVVQVGAVVIVAVACYAAIERFVGARSRVEEPAPDEVRDPVVAEYERLRRQVEVALSPGGGVDAFLVRELRDVAGRLLLLRGVDLRRDPERARSVLGDEVWNLVRPGHREGTLAGADLVRTLDRLEAL